MKPLAEFAPLFGCDAPERLCYSQLERELLEAVRNHSESEFNRFVLRKNDRELARELGPEYAREVIHRDNLVVR